MPSGQPHHPAGRERHALMRRDTEMYNIGASHRSHGRPGLMLQLPSRQRKGCDGDHRLSKSRFTVMFIPSIWTVHHQESKALLDRPNR